MLSSFPYTLLFAMTLVLGTMVSISSNNWLLMWMGMELNLMSFIPMMIISSQNRESEAATKYFLIQASASTMIIIMMMSYMISKEIIINSNIIMLMIMISLLTKLGMMPCHWWFPMIMSKLNWYMVLILMTWQKLAPMLLIMNLPQESTKTPTMIMISINALIGGLGGLNQSMLRPLLAYSSIGHMSWIMAANMVSFTASMAYLMIYIMTSTSLITFFISNHNNSFKTMASWKTKNPYKIIIMSTLLMSMGGLPPLLGFIPKALTLWQLIENQMMEVLFFLLCGTIINLSYYLNLMFTMMISPNNHKKEKYPNMMNSTNILLAIIATSPIILSSQILL